VVDHGQLTTIDLRELRREGQEVVDRVAAEMPQRRARQKIVQPLFDEMLQRVAAVPLPFTRLFVENE
jgi:hypothetical protein